MSLDLRSDRLSKWFLIGQVRYGCRRFQGFATESSGALMGKLSQLLDLGLDFLKYTKLAG